MSAAGTDPTLTPALSRPGGRGSDIPSPRLRGEGQGEGRRPRRERGAMLLLAMFAVAIIGILLAVAGPVWTTEMRRDKEADLLWVGDQYAQALGRYYAASPAQARLFPRRLEDLLLDQRQLTTVRYLRQLYRDPLTGSNEWGLVKDADGRISGVYSLGKGVPLKQRNFDKDYAKFQGADSYAKWQFVARATASAAAAKPAPTAGAAPARTNVAPAPEAVSGE